MASNIQIHDASLTARLELRALRKMARALCEHTRQMVATARARGLLKSKEELLQFQVFAERRVQLLELLLTDIPEVEESRMARLEKLISAIGLSRTYFMNVISSGGRDGVASRNAGPS
ncbi:MAG: hypothetical protein WDO12_05535 [Pseudomonadota bacterium]